MDTDKNKYLVTIIWVLISFIPAVIGSYYKPGIWYTEILKPSWTPPGWIFGPVWFLLYASMGIAAGMVWNLRNSVTVRQPILIFIIQLILNAAWSWIFFGLHELYFSTVEIFILFSMIVCTIILFYRVNKKAGLLLIPYLLWVGFASILNLKIWLLNR